MVASVGLLALPVSGGCRGNGQHRFNTQIVGCQHVQRKEGSHGPVDSSRRLACLSGATFLATLSVGVSRADAGLAEDFAKQWLRPEVDPEQAVVNLLDARGALYEIKALAATPMDSQERFRARALLPSFAKRLREVGASAPVVVSVITGEDKDATLSEEYGGSGGSTSLAVPIYASVGQVLTISGRGIRPEALEGPDAAASAIKTIEDLIAKLPDPLVARAQALRAPRVAPAIN